MRRKLLAEFAVWFAASRRPYDQTDPCGCIAAHAFRWKRKFGMPQHTNGIDLLQGIFGLHVDAAIGLYRIPMLERTPTRKVAAAVLSHFAKTGVVDWQRAERLVGLRTPKRAT